MTERTTVNDKLQLAADAVDRINSDLFNAPHLTEEEEHILPLLSVHYCNGEVWIEFAGQGIWDSENYPYESYTDEQENYSVDVLVGHLKIELDAIRKVIGKTLSVRNRVQMKLVE